GGCQTRFSDSPGPSVCGTSGTGEPGRNQSHTCRRCARRSSRAQPVKVDFAIVLVAAGASTRMGFPKLWADVCGQPLVARALAESRAAQPSELIFVVASERLAEATALAPDARVVAGGARRRDSVRA